MNIINRRTLWEGKFLRTVLLQYCDCSEESLLDTNGTVRDWETVERVNCGGIVSIVPFTDDGKVILIRQFRPPINGYVLELPAGLAAIGESLEDAARRELIEETGYSAGSLKYLIRGPMSSGSSSEMLDVFVATGLAFVGIGNRDETEQIEVLKLSVETLPEVLIELQQAGNFVDLKINGLVDLGRKMA